MKEIIVDPVPTPYGGYIQTCSRLAMTPTIPDVITLNTKLSVHQTQKLSSSDYPAVRYFSIGNSGHDFVRATDGFPEMRNLPHNTTDAGCFNMLPVAMREVSIGFTDAERADKRLRRVETHNGKTYEVYYLKTLDFSKTVPQIYIETNNNGVIETPQLYVPKSSDLTPVKPLLSTGAVLTATSQAVKVNAIVAVNFDTQTINDILEVCNILYGTVTRAMISEIALCAGADRSLPGDFNGASRLYTECISTVVTDFISIQLPLYSSSSAVTLNINMGNTETLLKVN